MIELMEFCWQLAGVLLACGAIVLILSLTVGIIAFTWALIKGSRDGI